MPQLSSFTYDLILDLSLFHLYSLPFIFSPLENFMLFFVIENSLSNFHFFSLSFDFLSNCFFGSSECQSVETYLELAEGREEWPCEKDSEGFNTDDEPWAQTDWYKESCSVENLRKEKWELENKRRELLEAGVKPEERPDIFNRIKYVARPQYPGDIYIDDTYIPEKDIASWKEVAELNSNHPWLKTKPKVNPPKSCCAIVKKRY